MTGLDTRMLRVALLAGVLVSIAFAAAASDWKKSRAPVDSVDPIARTITLDEEVFQVSPSCRIQRTSGEQLALSDLRVAIRPDMPLVPMDDVDFVEYEAMQKRSGWEIVEITVLDRTPQ